MQFGALSAKIYASAAVLYSTVSTSKCGADIIDFPWQQSDDLVRIYKTDIPWTPIELEEHKNQFAFVAWVIVLSMAVVMVSMVCIFCICWKLCQKHASTRHPSEAALVPSAVVTYQAESGQRTNNNGNRTSNLYGRGVVNFTFTSGPGDPLPDLHILDGPPAYSSVVSQTLPGSPANDFSSPVVSGAKIVETPPPAYISVAPFGGELSPNKPDKR